MNKVVVLVPFNAEQRERIEKICTGREVVFAPFTPLEKQAELLKDAEIVIGEPEQEAMAASPGLRWVQMTWAGTDKYTRSPKPFPGGIRLCSASGAFGPIMSQHALAGILSLYRNFPAYGRHQREHLWKDAGSERSIIGRTVLIFGTGNVGGTTAGLLKAVGAGEITGVRRRTGICPEGFDRVCTLAEADAFLETADIVIGCLPNADDTIGFLDRRRLGLMKKGSVLVNMGRGPFVDNLALNDALEEGRIAGAVLDVTSPEPLPPEHPLWERENCILTPHVAGPSLGHCPDTEKLIADIFEENYGKYLAGETLRNTIF